MKKVKYYSDGEDEFCYDLDYWKQYLEDEEITSIELIEMEFEKTNSTRFCTLHSEFLDGGECSKSECGDYSPQNRVRGKCVHKNFTLKETENKITIITDTKFEKSDDE